MSRGGSFLLAYLFFGLWPRRARSSRALIVGLLYILLLPFLLLSAAVSFPFYLWHQVRTRKKFNHAVPVTVAQHLPTLIRKRKELLKADDYGIVRTKQWVKELAYFVDEVLVPSLDEKLQKHAEDHLRYTTQLVEEIIVAGQNQEPMLLTRAITKPSYTELVVTEARR
jgi:hypothetical protein